MAIQFNPCSFRLLSMNSPILRPEIINAFPFFRTVYFGYYDKAYLLISYFEYWMFYKCNRARQDEIITYLIERINYPNFQFYVLSQNIANFDVISTYECFINVISDAANEIFNYYTQTIQKEPKFFREYLLIFSYFIRQNICILYYENNVLKNTIISDQNDDQMLFILEHPEGTCFSVLYPGYSDNHAMILEKLFPKITLVNKEIIKPKEIIPEKNKKQKDKIVGLVPKPKKTTLEILHTLKSDDNMQKIPGKNKNQKAKIVDLRPELKEATIRILPILKSNDNMQNNKKIKLGTRQCFVCKFNKKIVMILKFASNFMCTSCVRNNNIPIEFKGIAFYQVLSNKGNYYSKLSCCDEYNEDEVIFENKKFIHKSTCKNKRNQFNKNK